jgi:hypothetical protein
MSSGCGIVRNGQELRPKRGGGRNEDAAVVEHESVNDGPHCGRHAVGDVLLCPNDVRQRLRLAAELLVDLECQRRQAVCCPGVLVTS